MYLTGTGSYPPPFCVSEYLNPFPNPEDLILHGTYWEETFYKTVSTFPYFLSLAYIWSFSFPKGSIIFVVSDFSDRNITVSFLLSLISNFKKRKNFHVKKFALYFRIPPVLSILTLSSVYLSSIPLKQFHKLKSQIFSQLWITSKQILSFPDIVSNHKLLAKLKNRLFEMDTYYMGNIIPDKLWVYLLYIYCEVQCSSGV